MEVGALSCSSVSSSLLCCEWGFAHAQFSSVYLHVSVFWLVLGLHPYIVSRESLSKLSSSFSFLAMPELSNKVCSQPGTVNQSTNREQEKHKKISVQNGDCIIYNSSVQKSYSRLLFISNILLATKAL
jgi:hypothetical protein